MGLQDSLVVVNYYSFRELWSTQGLEGLVSLVIKDVIVSVLAIFKLNHKGIFEAILETSNQIWSRGCVWACNTNVSSLWGVILAACERLDVWPACFGSEATVLQCKHFACHLSFSPHKVRSGYQASWVWADLITHMLFIALAGAFLELELHNVDHPSIAHDGHLELDNSRVSRVEVINDKNRNRNRKEMPGGSWCYDLPIRLRQ